MDAPSIGSILAKHYPEGLTPAQQDLVNQLLQPQSGSADVRDLLERSRTEGFSIFAASLIAGHQTGASISYILKGEISTTLRLQPPHSQTPEESEFVEFAIIFRSGIMSGLSMIQALKFALQILPRGSGAHRAVELWNDEVNPIPALAKEFESFNDVEFVIRKWAELTGSPFLQDFAAGLACLSGYGGNVAELIDRLLAIHGLLVLEP